MVHMPLFFFDITADGRTDTFQVAATGLDGVQAEARRTLGEMLRETVRGQGAALIIIEVRGGEGSVVYRIEARVTESG